MLYEVAHHMPKWVAQKPEELPLMKCVIAQLICHRGEDEGHTWIDTLNRLWRKNHFVTVGNGPYGPLETLPLLIPEMLSVASEKWPLQRLQTLLHPKTHTRDNPLRDDLPIIVLSWFGRDFLIDGTTRIHRRVRDHEAGPHGCPGDPTEGP